MSLTRALRIEWIRTAPSGIWLGLVLAVALLLRVVFFVGLVSGDPQDDVVYYGNALALYNDGPRYFDFYRHLPKDFLANPIDQFNVRPMVTYPIAALFMVFGAGEIQASVWALVASLASVFVVYRLGVALHGRRIGLLAALLCAFYPLEVVNGTRILSDPHVGFFSSLALLLFVESMRRPDPKFYALAGMAAAGAYLANGRGLLFMMALGGASVILWVCAGFLAIFGIESIVYYVTTGDPLFSYHIQSGASYFKYLHEPVTRFSLGGLQVEHTNGRPFELFRSAFLLDRGPTNQFGLFFPLFAVATLYSLIRRKNLLLAVLAIGLFGYMEFGPLRVYFDEANHNIHYLMLFKQQRFLMMLTAPLVVMAAYFLHAIGCRNQLAAAVVTTILCVTAVSATARTRNYYRAGLSDLRAAASDVRANPDKMFFGDQWAVFHVRMFTRYEAQNLSVLNSADTTTTIRHGCLMLGGSRGPELLADYVESTLPTFARALLDGRSSAQGWRLIKEIKGVRTPLRTHDFRVYCAE
jgi:Dolichyl-phosphate-mannose-protein mannosyltransferase